MRAGPSLGDVYCPSCGEGVLIESIGLDRAAGETFCGFFRWSCPSCGDRGDISFSAIFTSLEVEGLRDSGEGYILTERTSSTRRPATDREPAARRTNTRKTPSARAASARRKNR